MKRQEVKREKNHKNKNKLSKLQILAIMQQILMHFIMIIVNWKIKGILIIKRIKQKEKLFVNFHVLGPLLKPYYLLLQKHRVNSLNIMLKYNMLNFN
jgi:hypothetical protein